MRQRTPFQQIDAKEARSLIARNDVLILDVRDTAAYNKSHIKGREMSPSFHFRTLSTPRPEVSSS